MTTQQETFLNTLTAQYSKLFETDCDYSFVKQRYTPAMLAEKITNALFTAKASKESTGVRATCKALGIKNTYSAIRAYLDGSQNSWQK